MKVSRTDTILGWAVVLVTAISPFGPTIYDAISENDDSFLFEYEYKKTRLSNGIVRLIML